MKSSSITTVKNRLLIYIRWLDENKQDLSSHSVEQFFYHLKVEKKLTNNSLNAYYLALKLYQYYLKDRGRENNFMENFKSFEQNKTVVRTLSPDEIKSILATKLQYGIWCGKDITERANRLNLTLTKFLAYTGVRYSEATELPYQMLSLEHGFAIITKTKNNTTRKVYLAPDLVEDLKNMLRERSSSLNDLVFVNFSGGKVYANNYLQDLKRRCEAAGIRNPREIHPHTFRSSFASNLASKNIPIELISSLLGHKSIQMAYDRYIIYQEDKLKNVAFQLDVVQDNLQPKDKLQLVKDYLKRLNLDRISGSQYSLTESNKSLTLTFSVH